MHGPNRCGRVPDATHDARYVSQSYLTALDEGAAKLGLGRGEEGRSGFLAELLGDSLRQPGPALGWVRGGDEVLDHEADDLHLCYHFFLSYPNLTEHIGATLRSVSLPGGPNI